MTEHTRFQSHRSALIRRHRRGLTLVELLASLAILSALAAACLGVIQTTSRAAAEATHAAAWSRAADALLDSIAADLTSADLDPIGDRARGDPRVRVTSDGHSVALNIRTRDPMVGPCVRRYATTGDAVRVNSIALDNARSTPNSTAAMSESALTALPAHLDASIDDRLGVLQVTVLGVGTRRAARLFRLDAEPTP